jgi:hypothetical protein
MSIIPIFPITLSLWRRVQDRVFEKGSDPLLTAHYLVLSCTLWRLVPGDGYTHDSDQFENKKHESCP